MTAADIDAEIDRGAMRMAAVMVAQRHQKADAPHSAYDDANPRCSQRVAEAKFVEECVASFAKVCVHRWTTILEQRIDQQGATERELRLFLCELEPLAREANMWMLSEGQGSPHLEPMLDRLKTYVATGTLPPKES